MQHVVTGESETLPAEAVFIGVGRGPVTEFLDGSLSLDKHRFIITDNLLRTSVAGVFAAGDVRATHLGQILTAAEDGAVAA
jgi:thioredoxin reductase (NADPH)